MFDSYVLEMAECGYEPFSPGFQKPDLEMRINKMSAK